MVDLLKMIRIHIEAGVIAEKWLDCMINCAENIQYPEETLRSIEDRPARIGDSVPMVIDFYRQTGLFILQALDLVESELIGKDVPLRIFQSTVKH